MIGDGCHYSCCYCVQVSLESIGKHPSWIYTSCCLGYSSPHPLLSAALEYWCCSEVLVTSFSGYKGLWLCNCSLMHSLMLWTFSHLLVLYSFISPPFCSCILIQLRVLQLRFDSPSSSLTDVSIGARGSCFWTFSDSLISRVPSSEKC